MEFEETIDLIAKGAINFEPYGTDVLFLGQLQEAFERLTDKEDWQGRSRIWKQPYQKQRFWKNLSMQSAQRYPVHSRS